MTADISSVQCSTSSSDTAAHDVHVHVHDVHVHVRVALLCLFVCLFV